jgi:hypothetical protein
MTTYPFISLITGEDMHTPTKKPLYQAFFLGRLR